MIDWYYHDPGEGRVGPLSAEELRKRFHDRRIQRDTLVWHHGLREWQPLERMAPEIGLETLQADASRPPPLPSSSAPAMSAAMPAAPRAVPPGKYTRKPLQQQKRTLPAGAIVAIVVAVIAVPALLLMGSIMLPAYRDYAQRATSMGAVQGLSNAMKQAVEERAMSTGRCPDNDEPRLAQARSEIRRRFSLDVSFDTTGNGCAFEVAINADGRAIDGKTLRYEGYRDGNGFAWDCSGGDMPDDLRPYECRNGS